VAQRGEGCIAGSGSFADFLAPKNGRNFPEFRQPVAQLSRAGLATARSGSAPFLGIQGSALPPANLNAADSGIDVDPDLMLHLVQVVAVVGVSSFFEAADIDSR